MLEINNLNKFYGNKQVLFDINLHVQKGDTCAFIGANGAGKTTTIKCALGLIPFEDGEIYIDGHNIETEPVACKQVTSYVPDNPELYEFMTGIQYLNFIADVYEMSYEARKATIDYYGEAFNIIDRLSERIENYSHGMQQKIALTAALMHHPKLIILDEPFVGLDPYATRFIREEFKRIIKEGCTILFSTHVLEVAEKLCNKVAIIDNGEIVLFDTLENALKHKSLEELFLNRMVD